MKIDLFANCDVLPADVYEKGVGGAELAMINWAEIMVQRGHSIRVYNRTNAPGNFNGVDYLNRSAFQPNENRDVFIVFRTPNAYLKETKAEYKIHWSHDSDKRFSYEKNVFPFVDKVVCVSPFHLKYVKNRYGLEDSMLEHIDLGVRLEDYPQNIEKIPGRLIYCSMPDRGLSLLWEMWPQIKEKVPHASLAITGDFSLWGYEPSNQEDKDAWQGQKDVIFLGNIERRQLVKEQLAAQVHSFPCKFKELFCISVAECQVAGAWPVTSNIAALSTTNQWGTIIWGDEFDYHWGQSYIDSLVHALQLEKAEVENMQTGARKRFDWHRICKQWERLIETGQINSPCLKDNAII